jgi:hypothetical protein
VTPPPSLTFYCVFLLHPFHLIPDSSRLVGNLSRLSTTRSKCKHSHQFALISVAYPFFFHFYLCVCGIVWAVGGHFGCWATFFALLRRREGKPCRPPRIFFVGKMAGTGGLFSPVSRVFCRFFYNSFFRLLLTTPLSPRPSLDWMT